MKVPNILGGLGESLAKRTDADAKTAAGTAAATATGAAPPSASSAMREIVSRYDMTDITPNDFSNMIQQLYAKGAISPKDMQELSAVRGDLEAAGVGADESVNLEDFYQQRLANAKANAAQAADPAAAAANIQATRADDLGAEVRRGAAAG